MSAPSPATSDPASPVRPRSRRALAYAVVLAVAVLVLLAVLFATGAFGPTSSGSSGTSSPYLTYDQARSTAAGSVAGSGSGPWSPVLAVALLLADNVSVDSGNLSDLLSGYGCTISYAAGLPTQIVVGRTPSSAPAGGAAYWDVGFVNASGSLRLVQVDLGAPTVVATLGGSNCTGIFSDFVSLTSVPIVDSPVIAANLSAAGGATWLADHPGANGTWVLEPGLSLGILSSAPTWQVAYTTCSASAATGGTGAEFNATFASATGALTHPAESGTTTCDVTTGVSLAVPGPLLEELARKA